MLFLEQAKQKNAPLATRGAKGFELFFFFLFFPGQNVLSGGGEEF